MNDKKTCGLWKCLDFGLLDKRFGTYYNLKKKRKLKKVEEAEDLVLVQGVHDGGT
jgi:hypothetical protein